MENPIFSERDFRFFGNSATKTETHRFEQEGSAGGNGMRDLFSRKKLNFCVFITPPDYSQESRLLHVGSVQ
jgi:hypothetical protein